MQGSASIEDRVKVLESIIADQREMLANTFEKPIAEIPQVFIPYKEVLELYDAGLSVPEDVTLMWTDDNYGYIRRLSDASEQKRKGGGGVYYHLSYWGRPHDYLWLSSTQAALIWYEMSRAYQNGAQSMWIANVGDIKPAEYNMEFFLDLAWDINSINENSIKSHLVHWSAREFGQEQAEAIANLMEEYYRLAFLRKPEYMGWSQTERPTPTRMSEFSISNDNELQRRIDAYSTLYQQVEEIEPHIPAERRDAYFQLVAYPVKGATWMNKKFLYAQQSVLSTIHDEKERLKQQAQNAYDSIVALTETYNREMAGAKWNHMMSMNPRNLPAYQMPTYHLADSVTNESGAEDEQAASGSPIFIHAADYSQQSSTENYEWKSIEGLGYSLASVTLFPFDNHMFGEQKPYLEYSFDIAEAGDYELEIRFLPTHANNFDHQVWIEVNGVNSDAFSLNTKGRSPAWKENVLRNYASVNYPVSFANPGKQAIKIYVNQTGIVLDQLAIKPDGYPAFYEIVR